MEIRERYLYLKGLRESIDEHREKGNIALAQHLHSVVKHLPAQPSRAISVAIEAELDDWFVETLRLTFGE